MDRYIFYLTDLKLYPCIYKIVYIRFVRYVFFYERREYEIEMYDIRYDSSGTA